MILDFLYGIGLWIGGILLLFVVIFCESAFNKMHNRLPEVHPLVRKIGTWFGWGFLAAVFVLVTVAMGNQIRTEWFK